MDHPKSYLAYLLWSRFRYYTALKSAKLHLAEPSMAVGCNLVPMQSAGSISLHVELVAAYLARAMIAQVRFRLHTEVVKAWNEAVVSDRQRYEAEPRHLETS